METVDVCIIGGGMGGASVAYHLAPHASVLLLEREAHVAYHSTGRSAALYAPQYGSVLIRRLTRATGPFLRSPPAGFVEAPILSDRGFLTIGRTRQEAELEQTLAVAAATGYELERLSRNDARRLVPSLREDAVDWGLLDPTAMDIDVELLLQGFLKGARANGLSVLTSQVVVTIERDGAHWRVRSADADVRCNVVVNAAGPWADDIAKIAGVTPLGLLPHRRTAFIFDAPTGISTARWPMVADVTELFYFKPESGRLLGSLAEEVPSPPCDAQPDDYDVAVAVDRIEGVLDFGVQRVSRSWTGLRTFGPDRDPVSGFDAAAPGFYWHAGLGGYGIQTSAALGEFAAGAILRLATPTHLSERGIRREHLSPARLCG